MQTVSHGQSLMRAVLDSAQLETRFEGKKNLPCQCLSSRVKRTRPGKQLWSAGSCWAQLPPSNGWQQIRRSTFAGYSLLHYKDER